MAAELALVTLLPFWQATGWPSMVGGSILAQTIQRPATLGGNSGMRNRIGSLIALLGLVVLAIVFYAAFRVRTATLQWDYDYERDPPCNSFTPATPPGKRCVLGFKVFLGTPTSRRDQQFVPNRFDPHGQITSKRITWTMPVRPYGNIQFCVVSVATAENGQTVESLPLCTTKRALPFGLHKIPKK